MKRARMLFMPTVCICGLLVLALFTVTGINPQVYLFGVTGEQTECPIPTWEGFWSGAVQQQFDDWYTDHFPFRSYLIRGYSQFLYSVMGQSSNSKVKIGKERYLFEQDYLTGLNYAGESKATLEKYAADLAIIQDLLGKQGKPFYYLISPSKAECMEDMLPAGYARDERIENTHMALVHVLEQYGVHYLDTTELMKQMQDFAPFTRNGTHWTFYAASKAATAVIEQINQTYGMQLMVPEVAVSDGLMPSGEDLDLQRLLNLTWAKPDLHYAQLSIVREEEAKNPSLYLFGTSFSHQLNYVMGRSNIWRSVKNMRYMMLESAYNGDLDSTVVFDQIDMSEKLDQILSENEVILWETNACGIAQPHFDLADLLARKLEEQ